MAHFKADADALEAQGNLHQKIAAFYRDAHDQILSAGGQVLSDYQRVNFSEAGTYSQWLNSAGVQQLLDEASAHDYLYHYFLNLAQQVRYTEKLLS